MRTRMVFSLDKLTPVRIAATVFTISSMICPYSFAIERGKQVARQVVREVVSERLMRLTDSSVTREDSLLDQVMALDIGPLATIGTTVSLERPEGTYVFRSAFSEGTAKGLVTLYDSSNQAVAKINISNLVVTDDNRIDYTVSVATADKDWTEQGVITGIPGEPGAAVALVGVNDNETRPLLVNYSGLDLSDPAPTSSPVAVTALAGSLPSAGQTATVMAGTCEPDPERDDIIVSPVDGEVIASVAGCAIVIIVVVLFVVVTCLLFGWWGC